MPNEFSVRLVPAKMAGVVSPRGGGLGAGILLLRMEYFFFQVTTVQIGGVRKFVY